MTTTVTNQAKVDFQFEDVLQFLLERNGRVVYTDIVTHFKKALSDPSSEARTIFKDIVNKLATVSTVNNTKYLILRDKYKAQLQEYNRAQLQERCVADIPTPVAVLSPSIVANDDIYIESLLAKVAKKEAATSSHNQTATIKSSNVERSSSSANQSQPMSNSRQAIQRQVSSSSYSGSIISNNSSSNNKNSSPPSTIGDDDELMPPPPPRPPPRRRPSFTESHSNNPADSIDGNKENVTPEPKNDNEVKKEIQELAITSGRVKEHAQFLNKLTSNGDFKLPMPTIQQAVVNKIRNGQHPGTDSDSGQLSLTEMHKKWIVAAATCEYSELVAMLKEDSSLAGYCDFMNGFSALHWAAKFGRPDIVKLIAGKYQVDPNLKSFSGSTPLHLAAQFQHEVIWELLTEVYLANIDVRDNYGHKPAFYLKDRMKDAKKCDATKIFGDDCEAASSTQKDESPDSREPKMNLRNKISYQSMLVRNKFRKSKSFQRRKTVAKS